MDQLRAALDQFTKQLAEQLRDISAGPRPSARSQCARHAPAGSPEHASTAWSAPPATAIADAARQMLDQLAQMLESLQNARPGQGGSEMEQAMNELGDIIRKEQQLRDRTFQQGQDQRRSRNRGERGNQDAMNNLQQDQQALRDRAQQACSTSSPKQGMGPGQGDPERRRSERRPRPRRRTRWATPKASSARAMPTARVNRVGRALDACAAARRTSRRRFSASRATASSRATVVGRGVGRQQNSGPMPIRSAGRRAAATSTIRRCACRARSTRSARGASSTELRKRFGESMRPQLELEHIERLLKDF